MSIVVPVYNDASHLALALDSVIAQEYADFEIIVVDDGSSDGSAEIADRYADRCIVLHQANAGQSAALEAGWHRATGSYLGYLSSDDLLRPTALSTLIAALERHQQAVLAYPDFAVINARGEAQFVVRPPEFSRRLLYGALRCLPGAGALFRRSAYERAGVWRRDFRQIPDLEFYLRLGLEGDFVHVPEVLADFRMHANSTTYKAVPAERADEPNRAVALLLSGGSLPPETRRLSRSMVASAEYLTALLHGQSGRRGAAMRHLASAIRIDPPSLFTSRSLASIRSILRARPIELP